MGLYSGFSAASTSALKNLRLVNNNLNKTLERLSTGYKLNRAADGAADLSISNYLNAQIRGNAAASQNMQQGLSMLNTADGALERITDRIQRARELVVSVSSDTVNQAQIDAAEAELTGIYSEINELAGTQYNGRVLLDGSIGATFTLQMSSVQNDTVNIATSFRNNTTAAAGLNLAQTDLSTSGNRTTALNELDAALSEVSANRAVVGQYTNTVLNQMDYLDVANENLTAADNRIRNADLAYETANLAKYQILQQSSIAALSQANLLQSNLMDLL